MADLLIVASKVKAATDKRVSADTLSKLSDVVEAFLKDAEKNATSDGMKTIKAQHVADVDAMFDAYDKQ